MEPYIENSVSRSELVAYLKDWRENTVLLEDDEAALDWAIWYLIHDFEIYGQGTVAAGRGGRMIMKPQPAKKRWWQIWRG